MYTCVYMDMYVKCNYEQYFKVHLSHYNKSINQKITQLSMYFNGNFILKFMVL